MSYIDDMSEMDDLAKEFRAVESERDEWKSNAEELKKQAHRASYDCNRWREIAKKMSDYIAHEQRCLRSEWEAGEPTKNGGYRTKYRGKWYQSKPVDKTPKCECGADEVLSAYAEALKK